ncbi:A24 family peptidase [Novosphingobium mangrovi (ex Huang et al. 2023)]|uniref:Prepilin peptidase n=1 Tax=Novosphingobium mangrovi (ex Huang et al. 2023) TaxID=2976432 RepID=A0ABT2I5I6_9SPHN|nr:prepilin peptidase [Novosphingobium mangrovi (ex Huang et al. 2023)]MCT2400069.1 prepilin peptidase [Novosphingobium mangrovi (ex Huang et al. 2023)]
MLEAILVLACYALVLAAAIGDVRHRHIPNLLCLVLAGVALFYAIMTNDLAGVGSHLLHAVLALAVGMGLFALGMIGGGDAKLYSAAALAIPFSRALSLLGWTSLVGLVLLVAMMILRRSLALRKKGKTAFTVPYGVAIAGGLMLALLPDLEVVF